MKSKDRHFAFHNEEARSVIESLNALRTAEWKKRTESTLEEWYKIWTPDYIIDQIIEGRVDGYGGLVLYQGEEDECLVNGVSVDSESHMIHIELNAFLFTILDKHSFYLKVWHLEDSNQYQVILRWDRMGLFYRRYWRYLILATLFLLSVLVTAFVWLLKKINNYDVITVNSTL